MFLVFGGFFKFRGSRRKYLVVVLLGQLVVGGSFLASNEASEAKFLSRFHHRLAPFSESSLSEFLLGLGALFL